MKSINGLHLANMYDNFYFESNELSISDPLCIDFSSSFNALKEARKISDHLPISIFISLR